VPAKDRGEIRHNMVLDRCRYLRLKAADHAGIAKRLGEYREDMPQDAWHLEGVAVEFAQCLPLVDRDSRLGADEKERLRAEYGAQAVALLRLALERGASNPARWENDPSLQPLRGRADFQALLAQVRKS